MKNRTIFVVVIALILAVSLLAASCGGAGSTTTSAGGAAGSGTTMGPMTTAGGVTTTVGGASSSAGTGSTAGGAQVTLQNIQVNPTSVTIKLGESVTFTNKDSVEHHMVGDKGEFDSGVMAPGATYKFTPTAAGTIAYHCTIHPSMIGTITVQ